MNNSFFSKFTPKEKKFYPLFEELSFIIEKASALLEESLSYETQDERTQYYHRIKECERQGDTITHKILDELQVTFITPFDREDIHDLASALDDVIDSINSCAKKIAIYNPKPISNKGKDLAKLIHQDGIIIQKAIKQLDKFRTNPTEMRNCSKELHDIENQGDDVYEMFIVNLFEKENDTMELIKIKEIMNELERTTDCAEQVGKIFNSFVVKYS